MRHPNFRSFTALCLVIALSACGSGDDPLSDRPNIALSGTQAIATTRLGQAIGEQSNSVVSFKGVRFALSAAGEGRWKPPTPSGAWTQPMAATKFSDACPSGNTLEPGENEDCLFLNIYAPQSVASGSRDLPVLFWIHGGANASGSASDYDPSLFVQQEGVVVVTTNYRVGVLGFLAHPAIDGEGHGAANYGLLDQQLALHWVKDHIRAFGGDPSNVTVFGASSGGLNILNHMVSPSAKGLFQKAIVQSGAYQPDTPSLAASQVRGINYARSLGCSDSSAASCLRTKPLTEILARQGRTNTASSAFNQSTVDGRVIPQTQRSAFLEGKFERVPVIQGVTRNEGRAIPSQFPEMTAANYETVAANYATTIAKATGEMLVEYPLSHYADPFQAASAIVGDGAFVCPSINTNRALSAHVPVFAYEFDEASTAPFSSGHYADVEYLFTVEWAQRATTMLGEKIRHHFTQFARTGDPNFEGIAEWKRFTATDGYMRLIAPVSQRKTDYLSEHHCAFWGSRSGIPENSR
ncbi:carboxylesterase/lipase family protein [Acidovorax sp. ACV01]|uniref:carboxylesterase/lipase family protein n=1 Tax=Acidovorax sp. ACV01 TaxID=2769311 RepID=UPI00177EA427|nr:carboxylesterase family protein [Acidovorax sp. ACV01]MBD9394163.1 carboxylesterase family protein [Acidovorax sp. ACV01]